jgi:hypothetical protein
LGLLVFQVVLVLLLVEPRNIGNWLSASGCCWGPLHQPLGGDGGDRVGA